MINSNVKGFNQALNQLNKDLSKITTKKYVTVGVHEDENARPDGGINNATLGAVQHFGTDNIPARPWLDVGVESAAGEIVDTMEEGIEDGLDAITILNRVGQVAVAGVQNYMDELSSPANAQSTIDRKGTDNPLIDTGELKQSVNYDVVSSKPTEGIG